MVMIASGPVMAKVTLCEDCPPDCPMMARGGDAASTVTVHQGKDHPGNDHAKQPCTQILICQSSFVSAPALSGGAEHFVPHVAGIDHGFHLGLPALSRPPDPALRPPINI
jgi:hypothetical protein